jgi:hypothetical protein
LHPSRTEIAVLSSAAILQLPKGLVLSFAKAPINAIFCPVFWKQILVVFKRTTIDFCHV